LKPKISLNSPPFIIYQKLWSKKIMMENIDLKVKKETPVEIEQRKK